MVDYESRYFTLLEEYNKLKKGTLINFQETEIHDLQNEIHKLKTQIKLLNKNLKRLDNPTITWKYTIKSLIMIKWKVDEVFTLQNFYDLYHDTLKKLYPMNNTIDASIRGTLEKLRDANVIRFIDNRGSYALI